jgi:hypothetical protein
MTKVIVASRNFANAPKTYNLKCMEITVELHLAGSWFFEPQFIQIGLTDLVNLSIILPSKFTLKLPVIGSSTVQCYDF